MRRLVTSYATMIYGQTEVADEPDRSGADRGEPLSIIEPLLLSGSYPKRSLLSDLSFDLAQKSSSFVSSLPPTLVSSLAELVRSMNCYYSNLIEGHTTHLIDIEHALRNQYSDDRQKRDLQLEARAHIFVQRWIDDNGLPGGAALTSVGIREIHRRFCQLLPEDLLWVDDPSTQERVRLVPGELRERDVKVGRHVAISPGAVPRFLHRFQQVYSRLGKSESIISSAAAHHRLLWLHPFLDGNGRVARLMSHAQLLTSLENGGLWSIARGLARNVNEYKRLLAACDETRRSDLDGRGTLSEAALGEFTQFFLEACIDQVTFMRDLMRPDNLRARIQRWVEEEITAGVLPAKSGSILDAIIYRGELPRGETGTVLGTGDRQARRVVSALLGSGAIVSESHRAPLRLAFPAKLASRWMPGLFPEGAA